MGKWDCVMHSKWSGVHLKGGRETGKIYYLQCHIPQWFPARAQHVALHIEHYFLNVSLFMSVHIWLLYVCVPSISFIKISSDKLSDGKWNKRRRRWRLEVHVILLTPFFIRSPIIISLHNCANLISYSIFYFLFNGMREIVEFLCRP